ncbi:hypothetical protein C8J57DRAFT_1130514 [Mycena rebaudengoi]|nr:hypothetical protein C8J57DRAFT_1130514 [Mycena rebaudengoi]
MRSVLSAVYFCITLASAVRINQPVAVTSRAAQTCGDTSDAVLLYQFFNSATVDYFYTTGAAGPSSRTGPYNPQGGAGFVFATEEESTVPFYRLHKTVSNGNVQDVNFWTTNTTEVNIAIQQGFSSDLMDPAIYIYPTEICGAVPFYRVFNSGAQANFYTTSKSERLDFIVNMGYTDLGIAGYIYPLVVTQCN